MVSSSRRDRDFLNMVSNSRLRPRLFKYGLKLKTETKTFQIWSIAQTKILLAIPQRLRRRKNIPLLYICGLTKQTNEITQFVCNPLFHLGLGKVAEIWCPMYPGSGSYAGNVERCVDNRLPCLLIPHTNHHN